MPINFKQQAQQQRDQMVTLRRDLHRHPELGFQEVRTARLIAEQLNQLGMEVRTGVGKTGVVGLLEGSQDGPTVLIRADMDALPIDEANQTDYISETPGVMHACGHDGHVTVGLSVARMLSQHRDQLAGRLKFVFQPAEEIGQGAAAMIADGVLSDPRPDYSLGLHLWNQTPVGLVAVEPGPVMAAADFWTCIVTGKGGHGAAPHQTHDPIIAVAQIISTLQTIVARNLDALESGVISVGRIQGGDAGNVIPDSVKLWGTIRTFLPSSRDLLIKRLREISEGVAAALNCEARIEVSPMTQAVNNNESVAAAVHDMAAAVVGNDNVHPSQRTMIAEDVGLLMDDIPGCFFFVGTMNTERGLDYPHHNPHFDIDEDALPIAAAVLAGAAAKYLIPE